MRPLIGLTGLHGSGKGVLCDSITEHFPAEVYSFSGTARDTALRYNPWIVERDMLLSDIVREDGWRTAKDIPRVRSFLNALGVALDDIDRGYVTRKAQRDVAATPGNRGVIYNDCYTADEGDFIRSNGGVIVHVVSQYEVGAAKSDDPFQNSLPAPDMTIVNSGEVGCLDEAGATVWKAAVEACR